MSRRGLVTLTVAWVAVAGAACTSLVGGAAGDYVPWIVVLAILEIPAIWAVGTVPIGTRMDGPARTLFAPIATVLGYVSLIFGVGRLLAGLEHRRDLETLGPAGFLGLGVGCAMAILFARAIIGRPHPHGARVVIGVLVAISTIGVIASALVPLDGSLHRVALTASAFAGVWAAPLWVATLGGARLPEARAKHV
jgi:hypothetical protein